MKRLVNKGCILLIMVSAGVFQNCRTTAAKEEAPGEELTAEPIREATTIKAGGLTASLRIPGELVAFQQVDLYAKVSSFVKTLFVDVGSPVRAGQLLATLEAPELTSQLVGAQSRLKSQEAIYMASKAAYDRLLETSKTPGTVSQNDLDNALARQKSDLAQLESARSVIKELGDTRNYLEIRAPFSGVISARNVSTGAYVGPSGKGSEFPLFSLVDQSKLRLVVSVPEVYTSYLQKGSEVTFTVKSQPEQRFTARVSRLAGMLDLKLRSQRTEMDVANAEKNLLPGMIAEVSIPINGEANTFLVPKSAVLNSGQGVFIQKVVENKVVWLAVKTGRSDEENIEVYGELKLGETILKQASEEMRDGAMIQFKIM